MGIQYAASDFAEVRRASALQQAKRHDHALPWIKNHANVEGTYEQSRVADDKRMSAQQLDDDQRQIDRWINEGGGLFVEGEGGRSKEMAEGVRRIPSHSSQ
jgi:hypothetical protein